MNVLNFLLNMLENQVKRVYPVVAVTTTFSLIITGMIVFSFSILLLLKTKWWPIAALYLIWIFIIDRNIYDRGGRPSKYVRNSTWFQNVFEYFPIVTTKQNDFELDLKKNYLFCVFPHGIIPAGLSGAMIPDNIGCKHLFPKHNTYLLMIKANFFVPVLREMLLSVGCCSNSKTSMNWILSKPNGGNIAGISIGGGKEALTCIPGEHKVIIRNKKGFVKIAILNGSPLVPVYSFGETDLFESIQFSKSSVLGRIQSWLLKTTGIAFLIFKGRNVFNIPIPFIPRQKPVNVIIGEPIEVIKNSHPTQEEIDNLHDKFISELHRLFEDQKHKYVSSPETTHLNIQ